jgi:hypothetical protein
LIGDQITLLTHPKIKDNVDHAGHSQLLVLLKVLGPLRPVNYYHSLNLNLLIVIFQMMEIKDVMVEIWA